MGLRSVGTAALLLAASASVVAYDLQRLSQVEDPQILGTQGNADATGCVISDDAAVIGFLSGATNLALTDQNGRVDAFLDVGAGLIRVSRNEVGGESPMNAAAIAVSADGQFVAFRVSFDPLVDASDEWGRIYRLNRNNGNLVMVADYAPPAPGTGAELAISDDGRYIAYTSNFAVVPARTGNRVFRFDAQTGTTILVDVDMAVAGQNGNVGRIAMDASGNLIAFDSDESDLVANDTNGERDVFVRDIGAGTTTRVSKRSNGAQANGASELADVSDDGVFVLFSSLATNLDSQSADANNHRDVFRHNIGNGNTRRASLDENGLEFPYDSIDGALSGDGQFAWLISYRNGSRPQLWRKNMNNEAMLQVTNTQGFVGQVDVDDAGNSACFIASERSTDLSSGDSNARDDVYRVTISGGATVAIVREGQPIAAIGARVLADDIRLVGLDNDGSTAVVQAKSPQFDADTLADLAQRDEYRAYLIDTATEAVDAPCRSADGTHTNGDCEVAAISGNGRFVFFSSDGDNLHPDVPDAPVNWNQLYRRDLQTGALTYITRDTLGGVATNGANGTTAIAVDDAGSLAVFVSFSDELVANDSNNQPDVFLWDASAGITRINLRANGTQANAAPYDRPFISGDGEWIVFAHAADNLIAGDTNGKIDLFLYQVSTGTLSRIAQPATQSTDLSRALDFSRDGEWLAFYSAAPEFGDPSNSDLFLWRRSTGLISTLANDLLLGHRYTEPVAFIRDSSGLFFGVDSDPSPTADSITLNRRYFALFPMLPAATVPATPATDLRHYALGGTMFVANDQSAYVSYNWPLSVFDNNRRFDVGKLLSGYGVAEFDVASVDVPEGVGTFDFDVFRRDGQAFDASVFAVPANGSATNGSDFNVAPAGLFAVWLDGVSGPSSNSIGIVDDNVAEPTETFTLTLDDYSLVAPGAITTLTVNIIDNDGPLFADGFE
ncbi:MAG: hypothetical protein KA505_08765 [Xanthomonadales bacterium]|nr:hypothetical protein [Xanthomonadales bacterium]MBP6078886.1 hypothetical protein [Xanthomonadales bacterium]MBP7622522.1 hypothetical protein [Xanthomonadales bacterium]